MRAQCQRCGRSIAAAAAPAVTSDMRAAGCVLMLAALAAARPDRDFEFDDDALQDIRETEPPAAPARHRFVYDPHSELCRGVACGAGERCVLRDNAVALCVTHDTVNAVEDSLNGDSDDADAAADRCVQCGGAGGGAVCGADNRTYWSLCALDLANCRARSHVRPRCHRACPCEDPDARSQTPHRRSHHDDATGCSVEALSERLLAWFAVLQRDAPAPDARGFGRDCKPEVRWMFEHLDTDGDGLLSDDNLYALEHDDRERCLRPFLRRCAAASTRGNGAAAAAARGNSVAGAGVSRRGWCACMRAPQPPCAAMQRRHKAGGWSPACDERGWFLPRQCRGAACWCADRRGRARPSTACLTDADLENLGLAARGAARAEAGGGEDAEDAPDDDDGSGHAPAML